MAASRKLPVLVLLAVLFVAFPEGSSGTTVLETADANGATMFTSLVRKCAFLKKILDTSTEPNGVTVFAFSNKAYAESPAAFKKLMETNTTHSLQWAMEYHVSFGATMSTDIKDNSLILSLFPSPTSGASLPLQYIRGNIYELFTEQGRLGFGSKVVTASGAPIIKADMMASNGIVHIIDKVMFPMPTGVNMPEFLTNGPMFSTLAMYLGKANLTSALKTDVSKPLTIFAPSNAAFKSLPKATVDKLNKNMTYLQQVLEYHVVAGAFYAAGLYDNESLHPLYNKPLLVQRGQGGIYVQNAKVIQADNTVTNGVVHEISAVLIPPM